MKVRTSIRTQIYAVLALTTAFCVIVALLSGISTQEAIQGTRIFFDCNSALSDFYVAVEEMDSAARDWLYSDSDEEYERYRLLSGQAGRIWS